MITSANIGAMSLNISFVLYLVVYLPQIIHNRTPGHIADLSPSMHLILYISYCLDLFYGFSSQLQWQYKTVSIISLSLLFIQHAQLSRHYLLERKWSALKFNLLFMVGTGILILYFFVWQQAKLPTMATQITGYIARLGFLIYILPQIIKNRTLKSTRALSIKFIYLSLTLSFLDMISAWCLNWGWPNKLGSPITISLLLIILMQTRQIRPSSCAIHKLHLM